MLNVYNLKILYVLENMLINSTAANFENVASYKHINKYLHIPPISRYHVIQYCYTCT
jgi:hypothetical protein